VTLQLTIVVPSAKVEPLGGLQAIAPGAIGSPPLSALTTYVSVAPAGLVASAVCPGGNLRFGGAAFTVHDRAAGLESVLPAASVDRTWNEWVPSASPEYACGELQD
jgi:hypothetical protein